MGYTTTFTGHFGLDRPLTPEHLAYLKAFAETRRMRRDNNVIETLKFPDPVREATSLQLGVDGEFFVGVTENHGQVRDESVLDYNRQPYTQPGLWCQWIPTEDGKAIVWDGSEKFYAYIKWLNYIIASFLFRWGYRLNGVVEWQGESDGDRGKIIVVDNVVTTKTL